MPSITPVFYDESQSRWWRARLVLSVIGAAVTIVLTGLLLVVVLNPVLPALHLPSARALPQPSHTWLPEQPAPEVKIASLKKKFRNAPEYRSQEKQRPGKPKSLVGAAPGQILRTAFYVPDQPTSLQSLKEHAVLLDWVFPIWMHSTGGGITYEKDLGGRAFLGEQRPKTLQVAPVINNHNGEEIWNAPDIDALLSSSQRRQAFTASLVQAIGDEQGLMLDIENLPDSTFARYSEWVRELAATLHARQKKLFICVEYERFKAAALARDADYLLLMAYDQHDETQPAGPIAGQEWFTKGLDQWLTLASPEKLILGIGNYAYDWTENEYPATDLSFQEAVITATESESGVSLGDGGNPSFAYEEDGKNHQVWLLDAVTAFNQMQVARRRNVNAFGLWRLGAEDPGLWTVWEASALNEDVMRKLATIPAGYDVSSDGEGEILRVASLPRAGRRTLAYSDAIHLITTETYAVLPSSFLLEQRGHVPGKVVLTFDDGPDDQYTAPILDILKRYHVPATFFVIGANALDSQDLLERMVAEGHEVGNHTFTHPNIAEITPGQIRLELSATERLLESSTGRKSVLFRPPYVIDAEPETAAEVTPLLPVEQAGYLVVGEKIDSQDWTTPGANAIVANVMNNLNQGSIILMHDGGGNREQTIAALPKIIEGLQARHIEITTIAGLLGKSRDEIMPPVTPGERVALGISSIGFGFLNALETALEIIFGISLVLGLVRLALICGLAVVHNRRRRPIFDPSYQPRVSVVVPAYNEEKVVIQTVESLLASTYPALDVIVVDDGSKDLTFQVVEETFRHHPRVKVFTKPNGGKARALNFGIEQTDAEIIVALDADTVFLPDTVEKLVRHFSDPKVGAVAGNVKVGNRRNLMTRWQALEYITSQNLERQAFDLLNCITVVPGAVGAWRREAVIKAGGFTHNTLAEDADLTISIRGLGYQVTNEKDALAYTEAPDTVSGFLNQRFRWMFGTLQAAFKHRRMLFRKEFGALGWVALPNVIVFQIFFPLISPAMDVIMLWAFLSTGLARWQHPQDFSSDALMRILFYYALFTVLDVLVGVLVFSMERREDWWLLFWLPWQRFCYRQLMYVVAIRSTLAALKGVAVGWGNLERKATVVNPAS